MAISIEKVFGNFDESLILRARRSEVLASNLANADTPNYKARDFDFKSALDRMTLEQGEGVTRTRSEHLGNGHTQLRNTHAHHIQVADGGMGGIELSYQVPDQPSLDGNTVDADLEKVKFSKNADYYQANVTFLTKKITGLKELLKEQ